MNCNLWGREIVNKKCKLVSWFENWNYNYVCPILHVPIHVNTSVMDSNLSCKELIRKCEYNPNLFLQLYPSANLIMHSCSMLCVLHLKASYLWARSPSVTTEEKINKKKENWTQNLQASRLDKARKSPCLRPWRQVVDGVEDWQRGIIPSRPALSFQQTKNERKRLRPGAELSVRGGAAN
jgi:hypothetical protein